MSTTTLIRGSRASLKTVHCFDTELEKPYERPYKEPLHALWREIVACPHFEDVFAECDDELPQQYNAIVVWKRHKGTSINRKKLGLTTLPFSEKH